VRCGKCGRKMMVHYSGRNGSLHRYSCSRTYLTQGTCRPCQSIGGRPLDSTVIKAFLQAVNPASVQATARAVDQLQAEYEAQLELAQLAVEQAEFEAGHRQRQFDACEPENRLVARTLETALEQALAAADQRRRALSDLQRQRPAPLSDAERRSLRRLAGNLGSIWKPTPRPIRTESSCFARSWTMSSSRSTATTTPEPSSSCGRAARAPSWPFASTTVA
jgi:hypothetical protein